MLHRLKRRLYFVVAAYFAFWAKFVLRRWRPHIVVITGSSGKTTVLHLVEAQLGDRAVYGHHANGAIGIPFHILGLETNVAYKAQWLKYLLAAPLRCLRRPPAQKLYVVEADCDRPREGKFTAGLLKPEVTLWVSVSRTHSMNFDGLVRRGRFKTHEAAIAYEFGYFVQNASRLVMLNADQPDMIAQAERAGQGAAVKRFSVGGVSDYKLTADSTRYKLKDMIVELPGIHPKELGVSLQMVEELSGYVEAPFDAGFSRLRMPPGRSNLLRGKKGTTIIDSTYNTGLGATMALLELFQRYPHRHKWLVMGDILEQGSLEKDEHQRLAHEIIRLKPERVVLLGARTKAYTYPILQAELKGTPVAAFDNAGEVLDYLEAHLEGGEALLFKGARGLEGVIEQLLNDPADAGQLVRRGPVWTKRRQAWGLPR